MLAMPYFLILVILTAQGYNSNANVVKNITLCRIPIIPSTFLFSITYHAIEEFNYDLSTKIISSLTHIQTSTLQKLYLRVTDISYSLALNLRTMLRCIYIYIYIYEFI